MNKIIKQAFTLIELLVVIAIIGILSGLIVVGMSSMTNNANLAKAQVFSNSLRNSLMGNIVAEWRFDGPTADGSTATANDILDTWSKINNGTIGGGPIVKTGSNCVNGNCLQFDGIDDYVDFGSNSSLSMGTGDATVSLWANFDNALAPQNEALVYCGSGADTQSGYRILRYSGTSRLYFQFTDAAGTRISAYLSPTSSLVDKTWYNVVVVFTRSSTAQAYINGVKQSLSADISGHQGNIQNYTNYRIGAVAATSYQLAGKMDEVRVFSAAMPISQIKEEYYAGLNSLYVSGGIDEMEYSERLSIVAKR